MPRKIRKTVTFVGGASLFILALAFVVAFGKGGTGISAEFPIRFLGGLIALLIGFLLLALIVLGSAVVQGRKPRSTGRTISERRMNAAKAASVDVQVTMPEAQQEFTRGPVAARGNAGEESSRSGFWADMPKRLRRGYVFALVVAILPVYLALILGVASTNPSSLQTYMGLALLWAGFVQLTFYVIVRRQLKHWRIGATMSSLFFLAGAGALASSLWNLAPWVGSIVLLIAFAIVGAAVFYMKAATTPPGAPVGGLAVDPWHPKRHLRIGATLSALVIVASALAVMASDAPLSSLWQGPTPATMTYTQAVWATVGNATTSATLPGSPLGLVPAAAPIVSDQTDALTSPNGTSRIEVRLPGSSASVTGAEALVGGSWSPLNVTGGANGVWQIDDGRISQAQVRFLVEDFAQANPVVVKVVVDFDAQLTQHCHAVAGRPTVCDPMS